LNDLDALELDSGKERTEEEWNPGICLLLTRKCYFRRKNSKC